MNPAPRLLTGLFLLGWPAPLIAQQAPGAPWDQAIIDLEMRGDADLERALVLGLLPANATLTPELVRELIRALYATGRLRNVEVSARAAPGGAILILTLEARQLIREITFYGLGDFDEERARRGLGLRPGQEFAPERLDPARDALRAVLADAGYRDATVLLSRGTAKEGGVTLGVQVERGEPTIISEVRFRGGADLELSWFDLSLSAGAVFDRAREREDTRHLKESLRAFGYYEARVDPPKEEQHGFGVALVYDLSIGPRYEVDIVGLVELQREEALSLLSLENEGVITGSTLDAAARRLQSALRERGYTEAEVQARVAARADGFGLLRVEVAPGPLAYLEAIEFPGAVALRPRKLTRMVEARLAEGLPAPPLDLRAVSESGAAAGRTAPPLDLPQIPPARRYRPKALARAVDDIKSTYTALGYLSAEIGPPALSPDGEGLRLRLPVNEGPQTTVRALSCKGNAAISTDELRALGPLSAGAAYNPNLREAARLRVLELYNQRGYLYANVSLDITQAGTPEAPEVELRFTIREGPQVRVAAVEVSGQQATREAAVLRLVHLSSGEVLTYAALREAERRLLSLGIFESASVELEQPEQVEEKKRVRVTVRERASLVSEASAGFSTEDGPRALGSLTENNLAGRALALTGRLKLNDSQFAAARDGETPIQDFLRFELERNALVSLREPLLGELWGSLLIGEAHASHQRINRAAFGVTKNSLGFGLSTLSQPRRRFSFGVQGDIEQSLSTAAEGVDLEALQASLPEGERELLDVFEGETILASLRPRLGLDLRNDPLNPTRGAFGQIELEAARSLNPPGRELNFVALARVDALLVGYLPLGGMVLELAGRAGAVLPLSPASRTPPDRLFFAGGIGSVRGFVEEGLLPEDFSRGLLESLDLRASESHGLPGEEFLTPVTIPRSLGGSTQLLGTLTLRGPIPNAKGAQWELFFDAGNSWVSPLTLSPFALRESLGAGLRFPTPIGPVRIEGALKLDRRTQLGESAGQLHFAIGAL